jgi:cytochrome c oxidase assembly protein subunit 15
MTSEARIAWFRRAAQLGAALAIVVVVLGAWVRLTDAGLGCPDWPGCYGHLYPQTGYAAAKAWHEMIHRYAAASLGTIIVALLGWAVIRRKNRDLPLLPAVLAFCIVCLQGLLGALTVTLLLKPLIVTAHLLGGLSTLGLLGWLSLTPQRQPLSAAETALRKFVLAACGVLVVQVLLGGWTSANYAAVACPDFPTCRGSWWPEMDFRDAFVLWRGLGIDYEGGVLQDPARMAIHVTHRLGAAVTACVLIGVGVLTASVAHNRRLAHAGLYLVAAVLMQIAIGIGMVHFGIPLLLATLHNAGAAILVITMVWLLRALWPVSPATVLPSDDGSRTR